MGDGVEVTADPSHGGYFGFNTDAAGRAQALFSFWNADAAIGDSCKEFGGEGVGWSCPSSMTVCPASLSLLAWHYASQLTSPDVDNRARKKSPARRSAGQREKQYFNYRLNFGCNGLRSFT